MKNHGIGEARRYAVSLLREIGIEFDHLPSYADVAKKLIENGLDLKPKRMTQDHLKKSLCKWYKRTTPITQPDQLPD